MRSIETGQEGSLSNDSAVRAIGVGTRQYVDLDPSLFTIDHVRAIDEGCLGAARDQCKGGADPAEGIRPEFS